MKKKKSVKPTSASKPSPSGPRRGAPKMGMTVSPSHGVSPLAPASTGLIMGMTASPSHGSSPVGSVLRTAKAKKPALRSMKKKGNVVAPAKKKKK